MIKNLNTSLQNILVTFEIVKYFYEKAEIHVFNSTARA